MRNTRWTAWIVGGALLVGLAGCASPLGRTMGEDAAASVAPTTRWVRTQEVLTDATCAPCAPAPCAPKCYSGCGLPCEQGLSDWHLRGVGGGAFPFGEDSGDSSPYAGVDLGFTSACCWGVDLFYRTHCTSFDRYYKVVGGPSGLGEDKGRFHHIGLKGTYQRSIANSRWFGYGGLGVQYFWTSGYVDDDNGWGGFGELGVGYVLSSHWRIRGAVEATVQSTDVDRKNPPDKGDSRLLWFVAPVVQVEFDW